jgi:hypothetical protein
MNRRVTLNAIARGDVPCCQDTVRCAIALAEHASTGQRKASRTKAVRGTQKNIIRHTRRFGRLI